MPLTYILPPTTHQTNTTPHKLLLFLLDGQIMSEVMGSHVNIWHEFGVEW